MANLLSDRDSYAVSRNGEESALKTTPGVASKLAVIVEGAEKRQPPAEGTVVAIFMDDAAPLENELAEIEARRALQIDEDEQRAETEVVAVPNAVPDFDDMVARKRKGQPAAPALTPPRPAKLESIEVIIASTMLLMARFLFWADALIVILMIDARILGTAMSLRFDDGSDTPPIAHGWIIALLIPFAIAGYIKMQGTGGRLRWLIDRLAGAAIPFMPIATGIFIAAAIVSAFSSQGFGPPSGDDAATQAASSWLGSLSESIGTMGLAGVLGVATIVSFYCAHGILIRLRDLAERLAEIWPKLAQALRARKQRREAIELDSRAALLRIRIAETPIRVAAMINDAVQPAINANRTVYEKLLRENGLPERQLALLKASIERLEAGSKPQLLETYIRNALAPRKGRKAQRKKA